MIVSAYIKIVGRADDVLIVAAVDRREGILLGADDHMDLPPVFLLQLPHLPQVACRILHAVAAVEGGEAMAGKTDDGRAAYKVQVNHSGSSRVS